MDSDGEGCPAAERIKHADQLVAAESALCSLSGLLWVNRDSSVNSCESEPRSSRGVMATCGNELPMLADMHGNKQELHTVNSERTEVREDRLMKVMSSQTSLVHLYSCLGKR